MNIKSYYDSIRYRLFFGYTLLSIIVVFMLAVSSHLLAQDGTLDTTIIMESDKGVGLEQNYPNPFNPSTVIRFNLTVSAHVKLAVYDMLGREIVLLVDQTMQSGEHQTIWYAGNAPGGAYFYRITAGDYSETRRMTLIK